jgi:cell fate regulator YaaT (PSP1 superfamily)
VGEFGHKTQMRVPWGADVVVQTDRGIELGRVVGPAREQDAGEAYTRQVGAYLDESGPDFCRMRAGRILRIATEADVNEQEHLDAHAPEDMQRCAEFAHRLSLDLKVVTAEHLLGGERIVFYFNAPARVDFRQLVRELAQHYRTRIEMRQVGARDEARLVADYEICGRECCCKNFLKKLRPVNMKMAKLQKSTLDPSKVSGRCGRLRCCLRYEHIGYEELMKKMPRAGSRVDTEHGPGKVIERHVLTQLVGVRTDDDQVVMVPLEEIKAFDLPPAPPKPPPEETRPREPRSRRDRPDADRSRRGERSGTPRAQGAGEGEAATPEQAARGRSEGDGTERDGRSSRRRRGRGRRSRTSRSPGSGETRTEETPSTGEPSRFRPESDGENAGSAGEAPAADGASRNEGEGESRSRRTRGKRRRRRRPRGGSDGASGGASGGGEG